eukprot:3886490-Rhodomonas_salina.1
MVAKASEAAAKFRLIWNSWQSCAFSSEYRSTTGIAVPRYDDDAGIHNYTNIHRTYLSTIGVPRKRKPYRYVEPLPRSQKPEALRAWGIDARALAVVIVAPQ